MSTAKAIALAEAVKLELNDVDRDWSIPFAAERSWLPTWQREDLDQLRVSVVPLGRTGTRLTRARHEYTYEVVIDFQQLVDAADLATMDALVQLVDDEVTRFYEDLHYLPGFPKMGSDSWSVVDFGLVDDSVYSLERLHVDSVFEAAIALQIRGYR